MVAAMLVSCARRPPALLPHCDLTLARSALLSTGARPLRRPHPASRVRWLCATPVRHARPPLALSRMSFTTSTPSPPDTHVRRPHPPACPHPPPLLMSTPHPSCSRCSVVRRDGRQEAAQEEARQEAGALSRPPSSPIPIPRPTSSTPSHDVFIAPRPPPAPGGERRRRPVRPRGHQGLHRRPQRLRLQGRPLGVEPRPRDVSHGRMGCAACFFHGQRSPDPHRRLK